MYKVAILTGRRTRAVGGDVPFKESVVQGPRCDEIPGVSVTSEGLKLLWCRTGGDLPRRCRQADLFFEGELYWAVAWEYWLEGNNSSPQTHSALLNTRLPLKVSAPPRLLYCRAASYSVRCDSLCYLFSFFRVYYPCVLIPRVLKIRISKVCYLVIALMSSCCSRAVLHLHSCIRCPGSIRGRTPQKSLWQYNFRGE